MAMPKKGSRSIIVDNASYRWRVGARIIVEPIVGDNQFCPLLVDTSVPLPNGCPCCEQYPPVTPSAVKRYIDAAKGAGWQPLQKGKPFLFVADPELLVGATTDT